MGASARLGSVSTCDRSRRTVAARLAVDAGQRGVEHLQVDGADVAAHPVLEHADQEPAVLGRANRPTVHQVALLGVERAAAQACARVGWEYQLVGAAENIVTVNVRWLAGYRHRRHHQPGSADAVRQVFASPAPSMAGAEAAGDPIAVTVAPRSPTRMKPALRPWPAPAP